MGIWGQHRVWGTLFVFLFIIFIGFSFTNCNVTIEAIVSDGSTDTEDEADGFTNNGDDSSTTGEEVDDLEEEEDDDDDDDAEDEAEDEGEDEGEDEVEDEEIPETEPSFMWFHVTSTGDSIFLRWTEPAAIGGPTDNKVLIRRLASSVDCPTEESGTLVYNGSEQVFEDTTVTTDQTYCYKIWFDNDGYEFPIIGSVTEGTAFTDNGPAALLFHNQTTGAFYEWRLSVDGLYKSIGLVLNQTENTISSDAWSFEGMAELDDAVDEDLQEDVYPKDIVWRKNSTGALYYWLLNGDGTQQSSGPILVSGEEYPVAESWVIKGYADLNPGETTGKDYYNDIIWQNDAGYLYYWLLEATEEGIEVLGTCDSNGQNPGSSTYLCVGLMYPDPVSTDSWTLVAAGNLLGGDADPEAEVLWQSLSTGGIYIWELDSEGIYGDSVMVIEALGENWSIIKVIDFNFDGNSDVLLKNTSTNTYYIMFLDSDGDIDTTQIVYESAIPSTYSVVGVADIDGDGLSRDIIWQNSSTGALTVWFLNADGTRHSYETIIESMSLDWAIKASPEY
ncbi:MAG: VCBS repeat-containing protein [bacterium]|nr:VCBS repeat-containing protein [bacterium]MBU1918993.1 VCBS repeat-containing protein [bacterium]